LTLPELVGAGGIEPVSGDGLGHHRDAVGGGGRLGLPGLRVSSRSMHSLRRRGGAPLWDGYYLRPRDQASAEDIVIITALDTKA